MTTIAMDYNTIAADTQVNAGDLRLGTPFLKIFSNDEVVCAFSGSLSASHPIVYAILANVPLEHVPRTVADGDQSTIVWRLRSDPSVVWVCEGASVTPYPIVLKRNSGYLCEGSGAVAASAAMRECHDPAASVVAASKVISSTGSGVVAFDINTWQYVPRLSPSLKKQNAVVCELATRLSNVAQESNL